MVVRAFRELDDAILDLRVNQPKVGLVLVRAKGSAETVRTTDAILAAGATWFVRETKDLVKRVLKRIDASAKGFYAIADQDTAFVGTFLELLLASDRSYVLDDDDAKVTLGVTDANAGLYPMANGLSRLATRFYGSPESAAARPSRDARRRRAGLATSP